MAPVSLPSTEPAFIEWDFPSATARHVSEFNGVSQAQEYPDRPIRCSVRYPTMPRSTAAPILAALKSARSDTVLLGPVGDEKTPRGVATGTPLVNGVHAAGARTLAIKGLTISITGILKADDWLQVGSGATAHIHQVTADANSNGSGNATVSIVPELRQALADGNAIVFSSPKGNFHLLGSPAKPGIGSANFYDITFDAEEDF